MEEPHTLEKDLVLFRSRGPIKLGEMFRYTIHYTPKPDAVRESLWVYVRNLEAVPLRAAYLNGPYSLYVDMRPSSYDETHKAQSQYDQPKYEINVRAGQSFHAELFIQGPFEHTWTVDVVGEQLFSKTASVDHEITVGTTRHAARHMRHAPCLPDPAGAAFTVNIQDVQSLWKHPMPRPDEPLHIVVLTHGFVSNVTTDMLFAKESIDKAAAKTGENIICKGFVGNISKTDQGVKMLGRRLGDWIMFELVPTFKPAKLSFVGHSLGGLTQSYALGYIESVHPGFFDNIELVNFVTLATPFLGLSTENPGYVKLALDVGIIGKTGRDFGLSWTPGSKKPLLQTLPTGATHKVLKQFANRTVYANVVNDGVVPLRTSSLLYLDWKALSKSTAAQRGAHATHHLDKAEHETSKPAHFATSGTISGPEKQQPGVVKRPSLSSSDGHSEPKPESKPESKPQSKEEEVHGFGEVANDARTALANFFLNPFEAISVKKRDTIIKRTQTRVDLDDPSSDEDEQKKHHHLHHHHEHSLRHLIKKTTLFESGISLLNPPHPDDEFISDPVSRDDVVFHDRVYHEQDLPPRRFKTRTSFASEETQTKEIARAEEKMARAWHKDKSWRKVLVQLSPEAHNNIIVRRRFSNAYGWPVIHHLVANHFEGKAEAEENEGNVHEAHDSSDEYVDDENYYGSKAENKEEQPSEESTPSSREIADTTNTKDDKVQSPSQGSDSSANDSSLTSDTNGSLVADSDIDNTWFHPSEISDSEDDMENLRKAMLATLV